jgi:hypothetical protein
MSDTAQLAPDNSAPDAQAAADDSSASDPIAADGATAANGTTDAGTTNASSNDAQPTDAAGDAGTATAGAPDAPLDYKQTVPIPAGINSGLSAVGNADMIAAFGAPGAKTTDCSAITNAALAKLTVTASVGPFNVTGLKPVVDAVARVFAAVQSAKPDLYALLGTEGMSCVRLVRGSTTNFSNHSWGTAIDLKIGGVLTPRGSTTVTQGLVALCPFFAAEKFFWGAGFGTPDGMHFEMSAELLAQWKSDGTIP